MFNTIYVEQELASHPRVKQICNRFAEANIIECHHYGEIFNKKNQNFRLQKKKPALILANKHNSFVLPTPSEYGIGEKHNYYFSHMLNCIYDCRYCFLQGMYQSAHYLLFVNYEAFHSSILKTLQQHAGQTVHFFSGYDCDSLALEPVTGFIDSILPIFENQPQALLELRTKSTQIRQLLKRPVLENCVIAFSFTPAAIATALEHKTPDIHRRITAIQELQRAGWKIGLRFDPLIYHDDFESSYKELFSLIFNKVEQKLLHSVSLGSFRLPRDYFKKMLKLYPEETLFAGPLEESNKMITYKDEIRNNLVQYCNEQILTHIPPHLYFPCEPLHS